ncbi:MAG: protein kinase [Myxococcales bacterium]|nr:protein kinase [Myxococcales bacterium]
MSDVDPARQSFSSGATVAAELSGKPTAAPAEIAAEGIAMRPAESLFAGRYELLRELGRGGMGVVYQARDTMVGDLVALKTLEISGGASDSSVERFRREVRLARKITHPNVARTHDLGEAEGRHYLTMEFVAGIDLATLIRREDRLSAIRAAATTWMICEGLGAAHAAGVVHRDLKPANIIVERTGRVVLTDFGIARAFTQETGARTVGSVGTLVYMAPEQVTGEKTDPRTDVYAVGLLLYEMLTGELAFKGETPLAAAIARLTAPAPDPRALVPELPEPLTELILRCLEREPERRPESAAEVADVLIRWLESIGKTPEQCASMLQTSQASTNATGMMMKSVTRTSAAIRGTTTTAKQVPHTLTRRTPADTMGRVAVLPLRFRGRSEHDFLGEALAESIVDLLGRTHGVEVASASSSARFTDERDPRSIGEALGVTYVIDGTVQVAGSNARVTVRLIEVASGTQLWSHRFGGAVDDPFDFQDLISQQIGEHLRFELLLASYRDHADEETIEVCRRTRGRLVAAAGVVYEAGLGDLERCHAKHPSFTPIVPLLALMTLRGWFIGADAGGGIDWESKVRDNVALAARQASDLPETRLAQAMLAVQEGRFRDAVVDLRAALSGAPAYAHALQYLGNLQCEAGRAEEGMAKIRLSLALEPEQPAGFFELARCSALRGDMETYREAVAALTKQAINMAPVNMVKIRVAAWYGDRDGVAAVIEEARHEPGMINESLVAYGRAALGLDLPRIEQFELLLSQRINPRFASMVCQIACEELCLVDDPERALEYFNRAADSVLIDLEWADHCPSLAAMREHPGFVDGRRKVRERVEALWGA